MNLESIAELVHQNRTFRHDSGIDPHEGGASCQTGRQYFEGFNQNNSEGGK